MVIMVFMVVQNHTISVYIDDLTKDNSILKTNLRHVKDTTEEEIEVFPSRQYSAVWIDPTILHSWYFDGSLDEFTKMTQISEYATNIGIDVELSDTSDIIFGKVEEFLHWYYDNVILSDYRVTETNTVSRKTTNLRN